jgi:hypothetical protein
MPPAARIRVLITIELNSWILQMTALYNELKGTVQRDFLLTCFHYTTYPSNRYAKKQFRVFFVFL